MLTKCRDFVGIYLKMIEYIDNCIEKLFNYYI